ncbi:phosphatase PAP2 family protein [Streptomyces sp. NPDC007818]|uniref:phosphatase PAP2 family protein n=1 Tax=Streptomyces sp. NPDC007818 TaxID=3364780 RepID=UPI00367B5CB9
MRNTPAALLPPPSRTWLGPTAALAASAVVLIGVRYAGAGESGGVDARIGAAVAGTMPGGRRAALAVDFLGEPVGAVVLVLAAVVVCLLLRRPRAAVLVVAGTGLTVGATKVLKPLVGRTIHDGYLAYPSGHTGFLTAYVLVLGLLAAGRLGRAAGALLALVAALAAGAVMGWAQVALAAHHPTDTFGGLCTALAVVPASAWLIDRIAGRSAEGTVDG